jgi:hypothetical protein
MSVYQFKSDDFAISENGIDFFRNGFNYKTVPFTDIQSFSITKGRTVYNWLVVFFLGLVLLMVGIYIGFNAYEHVQKDGISKGAGWLFYLGACLVLGGAFAIYNACRTGTLFVIHYISNKRRSFQSTRGEGHQNFRYCWIH